MRLIGGNQKRAAQLLLEQFEPLLSCITLSNRNSLERIRKKRTSCSLHGFRSDFFIIKDTGSFHIV